MMTTQKSAHLAWCALVALALAKQDGSIRSPAQENLFLTRWLATELKQRRFPHEVVPDIQWLLQERGQLGIRTKLTDSCIGLMMKINASTFFEVPACFKVTSLPWPIPDTMSHDSLGKRIFPPKGAPLSGLITPDPLHFNTEMRKPNVTQQLLWMDYKAQAGELAMGHFTFATITGSGKNAPPLHGSGTPRR